MAAIEALAPNATLTSPTTIQFNQSSVAVTLNFTKSANLPGTSIASVLLRYRRGVSGSWATVTTNTALTTITHNPTDSAFDSSAYSYEYIVTDDLGGTVTIPLTITPSAYVQPTLTSLTTSQGTDREKGNNVSSITATLTRQTLYVPLTSWQLQYNADSAGWVDVGSATTITGNPSSVSISIPSYTPPIGIVNASSLAFRIKYTDSYKDSLSTVVNSSSYTITLRHKNLLVYDTVDRSVTAWTVADITALTTNLVYQNTKARTVTGVTASGNKFTYYIYAAGDGDLSFVYLDGVDSILGAFTKLTDVGGGIIVNSYGASVTYRIYKSNSEDAFTSNSLSFS